MEREINANLTWACVILESAERARLNNRNVEMEVSSILPKIFSPCTTKLHTLLISINCRPIIFFLFDSSSPIEVQFLPLYNITILQNKNVHNMSTSAAPSAALKRPASDAAPAPAAKRPKKQPSLQVGSSQEVGILASCPSRFALKTASNDLFWMLKRAFPAELSEEEKSGFLEEIRKEAEGKELSEEELGTKLAKKRDALTSQQFELVQDKGIPQGRAFGGGTGCHGRSVTSVRRTLPRVARMLIRSIL